MNNLEKCPGGGVLARFHRPGGWSFELLFLPGGWGIRPSKKLPGGFAQWEGWSGLELTDTLPTGNFRWMADKKINKIDYKTNGKKGLILEVDLEYPQELHDLHNDYPVAPETAKVSKNMLSGYCKKIAEKYNISIGQVNKLIPTLKDKKEYVLHYQNLRLYLDLGLKIKKVHQVLEFDQSPCLKQYIDFNTEKRKHAKSSFEKDFFKFMNNSVFGKTMENLLMRVDVKLVTQ